MCIVERTPNIVNLASAGKICMNIATENYYFIFSILAACHHETKPAKYATIRLKKRFQ